jgi:hypothetical protein
MDYNITGDIVLTEKYGCFRLTGENRIDYRQDCIFAMAYHKCDLVMYQLQNIPLNNLVMTSNQFKHILLSDCDAIMNLKIIFPSKVPDDLSIELQQFSRTKRNIEKIDFDIISENEIVLKLTNMINIVFYNHGNYLYFNVKDPLDAEYINKIILEFDIIFMDSPIRNEFLVGNEEQIFNKI